MEANVQVRAGRSNTSARMEIEEEAGRIRGWAAADESRVPVGLGLVCGGEEKKAARNRGKKSRKRRNARDQDGGALCALDRERRKARNRNGSRGRMGIIALEMQ